MPGAPRAQHWAQREDVCSANVVGDYLYKRHSVIL
jgi:hypothetical protein